MRYYVTVGPELLESILRTPPDRTEELQVIYSREGIFEVGAKVHQVHITDRPIQHTTIDGIPVVLDHSSVQLKEVWHIPLPHTSLAVTRRHYRSMVVEQSNFTVVYFTDPADIKIQMSRREKVAAPLATAASV